MSRSSNVWINKNLDHLLGNLGVLKDRAELTELVDSYLNGDYQQILQKSHAQNLFKLCLENLSRGKGTLHGAEETEGDLFWTLIAGLTAFSAFLQVNVTGPPITTQSLLFCTESSGEIGSARKRLLSSLSVDGLSVYQYIPHVELFCLARAIFTEYFPCISGGKTQDSKWMRIRINAYHQRLLSSGPSNIRLSDSAAELQVRIDTDISTLEREMFGPDSNFSTEAKVQFLLEKAHICIMQGLDLKARENIQLAKTVSGFNYAFSGALGKRTKFQEKDISQLVVFAKSKPAAAMTEASGHPSGNSSDLSTSHTRPTALKLNDDTLLESIEFAKQEKADSSLPQELIGLEPDKQPQLNPLDQIILLAEATLKDALSPLDKLNSEEILPYAVRVLTDKPTNWQIYTQALLVRSRIEAHRSRTQERSVLQLQAIVDQIVADTQVPSTKDGAGIPQIQVTHFLPRAKSFESAPINERLKFVFQLNSPTQWEIGTELAYGWSAAGSLVSALEIFKRLRLWAEVALCYHSVGQEDKARQVVRRQLYHSTKGPSMDASEPAAAEVLAEKWDGEIRSPPPPHAPRFWCILGDLDQDPSCWQRAWSISGNRYARAQRTLGEYYVRKGELEKARQAYMAATVVNRQNAETWSRLGDIDLRVGNWDGAIIAYQQSIMIDDTDAKSYSNLGSALYSKYIETMSLKSDADSLTASNATATANDDEGITTPQPKPPTNPSDLLQQSLNSYKRAASLFPTSWQIWDNVLTLSLRSTPLPFPTMLQAFRTILQIRGPSIGEAAIDLPVLTTLVEEAVSQAPSRGSTYFSDALDRLVAESVLPLLTTRSDVYPPLEKLALSQRRFATALSYAEAAWRMATSDLAWLEHHDRWREVVERTESLVSALENYGAMDAGAPTAEAEATVVLRNWRSKARSALRAVLGKARGVWDEGEEYVLLKRRLDEL
jgi:tetratricopeptide (TPR) repeat protein